MTIDQVTALSDGLSVSGCGGTLVLDRTRVREQNDGVDVRFNIAGTDLMPRIHLTRLQLSTLTWEEMASLLRHVAKRAANCN